MYVVYGGGGVEHWRVKNELLKRSVISVIMYQRCVLSRLVFQ